MALQNEFELGLVHGVPPNANTSDFPMATTLGTYPDGPRAPATWIWCASGFVARVVGEVATENLPDAIAAARILNQHVVAEVRS